MADFNKVGHRFPDGLRQIGGRFSSSGKLRVLFGHDDILLSEAASRNKRTSELEEQLK